MAAAKVKAEVKPEVKSAVKSAVKPEVNAPNPQRVPFLTRILDRRVQSDVKENVRIYVLCHTDERFEAASKIYGKYYWAVPVRMKYQDYTFENAFWKQLLEIREEWTNVDMVGVISSSAYKKLKLEKMDKVIRDRTKWTNGYYHFSDTDRPIGNNHPHLLEILTDVCETLKVPMPTASYCNYFMCTPAKMTGFIEWYEAFARTAVCEHPLAMTDAKYKEGALTSSELMSLSGLPYYSHMPFVLERLNKVFFHMKPDPRLSSVSKPKPIEVVSHTIPHSVLKSKQNMKDSDYLRDKRSFEIAYKAYPKDLKDVKIEFRYFCFRYIDYIRLFPIPEIVSGLANEAVLIEYRNFPHVEFLMRNAIHKLGDNWSYTIVCGLLNYESMSIIAESIHPNIKVVKTPYENLFPSQYSTFLATSDFWNMFVGEKILLFQEDTLIFGKNIDTFLGWDYIGAPWPIHQNDTPNLVGNGGFSLRSRKVMLDVISRISISDTVVNSSTADYMRNSGNTVVPEDVYFSKNIQELGLGKVASWAYAFQFSTETQYNPNSFGGHNFWINDNEWKKRIYDRVVIQFKKATNMKTTHRGGWGSVIRALEDGALLTPSAPYTFLPVVEEIYMWDNKPLRPKGVWCGAVHCTPRTPAHRDKCNIYHLTRSREFLEDLSRCMVLFTFSEYVSQYLIENIPNPPKIVTLTHPVVSDNIPVFNMGLYTANRNKHILQVGQQLRKMCSIFRLDAPGFVKKWLTGEPDLSKCARMINTEDPRLKYDSNILYYTKSYEEYDDLLKQNIVFIDLYDSAANNTVLECIVRNTPLIVNRTPGVVEYLGENYPLYFNELAEVPGLLSLDKITAAHEYLRDMSKERFTMESFVKSFAAAL